MGDRALVLFTDGKEVSPTVYLHWAGSHVPDILKDHAELMASRKGDVGYAAARFVGMCHCSIEGNLSLGLLNTDENIQSAANAALFIADEEKIAKAIKDLNAYSHGDAGVVVVNVNDFTWKAFGGYLARHEAEKAA